MRVKEEEGDIQVRFKAEELQFLDAPNLFPE